MFASKLSSMSEQEWTDLYQRLRLFTWKRYRWLQNSEIDLDAIVMDSILDILSGVRRYPPRDSTGKEIECSIFAFLCEVTKSKVSHQLRSLRRYISIDPFLEHMPNSESDLQSVEIAQKYLASKDDPEQQLVYKEIIGKMRELIADDELLLRILDEWIQDSQADTHSIAKRLGLSADQVSNARKRLSRKLEVLRNKQKSS